MRAVFATCAPDRFRGPAQLPQRFTLRTTQGFTLLCLLLLCQLLFTAALHANELKPFTLEYGVFRDNERIGSATMTLKSNPADNSWQLQTESQAKILIFKVGDSETSVFRWQDAHPQPLNYQRVRNLPTRNETTTQNFSWPEGKETGSRKKRNWQIDLKPDVMDRHSQMLKLIHDIRSGAKETHYNISDGGRIRMYHYMVEGEEKIEVLGKAETTLRVVRVRDANEERRTTIWLAPAMDYIPVRVEQHEADDETAELVLEKRPS